MDNSCKFLNIDISQKHITIFLFDAELFGIQIGEQRHAVSLQDARERAGVSCSARRDIRLGRRLRRAVLRENFCW